MNAEKVRPRAPLALVPALALVVAACGGSGSGQSGSAFTFLTVDLAPVGSVISNIDAGDLSTTVCARFRNNLKNPTVTAPSPLDDVQITSYTVTFQRFDGGTPPGPFTFNTSFRVPAGTLSDGTLSGNQQDALIVVVPASAKHEAPLRNPPPRLPLSTQADLVFKGQNGRGQRLTTEASLTVVFVSDTQETPPTCARL